jgi:pimeloyl-ACP methyl ester carboxylesterase/tetratricopeptide (TPR) repeat protein
MSRRHVVAFVFVVTALSHLGSTRIAYSQTAAPGHKHYDRTPEYDAAPVAGKPLAPRLQNLGVHTFPSSTRVERAQLFITQGLNLAYAFNHAEAGRAFAEAARLDPTAAMAYWGQALVLGPNINAPMSAEDEPKASALVQKALALESNASPRERAYIEALAARYTGKPEDRQRADKAYAEAMGRMVAAFPADLDARTLYAEALMDLRPWNYWTKDGVAYDDTRKALDALAHVIAAHKNHPGALHLWIHLWEATDTPERAEAEADRLLPLMPGAGHIVHMPAHIYQRVGRHADVITSNQLAAKADEDYIAQCRAQGLYPLAYYPHNLHFIWMGATASGQRQLALDAARKLANQVPQEALASTPILQGFVVVPYWAMVRFEQWDAILADQGPRYQTPFTRGVWHYARASAWIARGRIAEAERELAALKTVVADPSLKGQTTFSANSGYAILRIAPEVLAGEIAATRKDWDTALLHLERAVRYEDTLVYQEPHDWHAPVRQTLGRVLLAAGRPDEAEAVFWEDLKKNAESGWSLAGLVQALNAQGKKEDAALVEARLKKAWQRADIQPPTPAPSSSSSETVFRDARLANGMRLRYAERGPVDGPVVLMLHGYSDSWFSFSTVLPLMPPALRVIAPDQRGHGDSDRPAEGYSIDDFATDAIALLDTLGVKDAIVVGHSMGSLVARRIAERLPERVTRLVLVGAALSVRNDGVADLRREIDALGDPVDPEFVRAFQVSTIFQPIPEVFLERAIDESRKLPARVWKAVMVGMWNDVPSAQGVRVPTVILGGDKDAVFSVAEQRALADAIPGATLTLLKDIGHAVHWENPQALAAIFHQSAQAGRQ